MNGRNRRAVGQRHAERLGDARHRARGAHDRAVAAGRREIALHRRQLALVDPAGPSCHTGAESCFFRSLEGADTSRPLPILFRLEALLADDLWISLARSANTRAVELADALAGRIAPVPVRLADERLTTVGAHRALREAGVRGRNQRAVVDQVAAVAILQGWLDQRRSMPAGPATESEDSVDGTPRG